jgi:hypothetical protein
MTIAYDRSPVDPETGQHDPECVVTVTDDSNPTSSAVLGPFATRKEMDDAVLAFLSPGIVAKIMGWVAGWGGSI